MHKIGGLFVHNPAEDDTNSTACERAYRAASKEARAMYEACVCGMYTNNFGMPADWFRTQHGVGLESDHRLSSVSAVNVTELLRVASEDNRRNSSCRLFPHHCMRESSLGKPIPAQVDVTYYEAPDGYGIVLVSLNKVTPTAQSFFVVLNVTDNEETHANFHTQTMPAFTVHSVALYYGTSTCSVRKITLAELNAGADSLRDNAYDPKKFIRRETATKGRKFNFKRLALHDGTEFAGPDQAVVTQWLTADSDGAATLDDIDFGSVRKYSDVYPKHATIPDGEDVEEEDDFDEIAHGEDAGDDVEDDEEFAFSRGTAKATSQGMRDPANDPVSFAECLEALDSVTDAQVEAILVKVTHEIKEWLVTHPDDVNMNMSVPVNITCTDSSNAPTPIVTTKVIERLHALGYPTISPYTRDEKQVGRTHCFRIERS